MYRRRRPAKINPIAFSFDAFLDVVANVIGILLRLILVTWVGARSYHAAMEHLPQSDSSAAVSTKPAPRLEDDPLHAEIRKAEQELDEARRRLVSRMDQADLVRKQEKTTEERIAELVRWEADLKAAREKIAKEAAGSQTTTQRAALDLDLIRGQVRKLNDEIKLLEKQPNPVRTKELKYFTPTSKAVHSDEVIFELRRGRVTFVDLSAFLREVERGITDKLELLRTRWTVSETTEPSGAFRLRYVVDRMKSPAEAVSGRSRPGNDTGFEIGVSEWTVEPLNEGRGEALEAALKPTSDFRQLVDGMDTSTVVTFCVYPDSFAEFRALRDYLHERGFEVAARPLLDDMPIKASRNGTASRGQ
ncbi:MAG: PspA/IM30 family protein [Gemmataceae bacterium]|nr:PspA/IM30 family protein [Gemmataceae bacterium]